MCPVCITTAALMAAGAGSLGGVHLFVMKRIRAGSGETQEARRNGDTYEDRTHETMEMHSCNTTASFPETNGLPRASSI